MRGVLWAVEQVLEGVPSVVLEVVCDRNAHAPDGRNRLLVATEVCKIRGRYVAPRQPDDVTLLGESVDPRLRRQRRVLVGGGVQKQA